MLSPTGQHAVDSVGVTGAGVSALLTHLIKGCTCVFQVGDKARGVANGTRVVCSCLHQLVTSLSASNVQCTHFNAQPVGVGLGERVGGREAAQSQPQQVMC